MWKRAIASNEGRGTPIPISFQNVIISLEDIYYFNSIIRRVAGWCGNIVSMNVVVQSVLWCLTKKMHDLRNTEYSVRL